MIDIVKILNMAPHDRDDEIRKLFAIPDHKPLDWNLAKKMQAECDPDAFFSVMWDIYVQDIYGGTSVIDDIEGRINAWAVHEAEPYHYLLAAAAGNEVKHES